MCYLWLSFVFILMGENIVMLYAMAGSMGLGMAIGTVSPALVTASIFGQKKYGEAFGAANSIQQIGLSAGSLFVAFVFDTTGSYNPAWIVLLVLTAVTMLSWIGAYIASRKYCGPVA